MASVAGVVWRHGKRPSDKQLIRMFCSLPDKQPIVTQLSSLHEMDWRWKTWFQPESYADRFKLLHEERPGDLIRLVDVQQGRKYRHAIAGLKPLRQGVRLVAANLMRGRNVAHLFVSEYIRISESGDLRRQVEDINQLDQLEMTGRDNNHLAFAAVHDWYFGQCGLSGMLGRSAGQVLLDEELPWNLSDLRPLLKNAALIDKRLITNHPAILFSEEVTQLIIYFSNFLREERASLPGDHLRRKMARQMLEDLGKLVPGGVEGMHPMTDQWLRHGMYLGEQIKKSQGDESFPQSKADHPGKGSGNPNFINGKNLLAVKRAGVLHPFGPYSARKEKEAKGLSTREELNAIVPIAGRYTFQQAEQLTHSKVPMFPAIGLALFLQKKLYREIGMKSMGKEDYLKWNDTHRFFFLTEYAKILGKKKHFVPGAYRDAKSELKDWNRSSGI